MIKRIVLGLILLAVIAIGVLFLLKGQDNYDPSKHELTATNGIHAGSKLSITLPDQFDKTHQLSNETKRLIIVFAKETGHTVKEFLQLQEKGFLEQKQTLFIADISPMPTVIRNTFALPDLQKSAYSVLLIYDGKISETLKNGAETDKIVIANMKEGVVESIKFVTTADELKAELQ